MLKDYEFLRGLLWSKLQNREEETCRIFLVKTNWQLYFAAINFTCVVKLFFKFFVSDLFPKFFEDVNEVFYTYKSIGVLVEFSKNHPRVDLLLVADRSHFEGRLARVQIRLFGCDYFVLIHMAVLNLFSFRRLTAAGFYAFNEVYIVLKPDSIVSSTKDFPNSSYSYAWF